LGGYHHRAGNPINLETARRALLVSRTLAILSAYVVGHFGMEERLMAESGYQHLASHRAEHESMRIQVENMVDQYNLIGLDPTTVMRVLKKWLIDHVQEQDRHLAQFLLTTCRLPDPQTFLDQNQVT